MSKETCKNCGKSFEITSDDKEFYKKLDVPPPTLCHLCRQQRRLAFRNEMNLYPRKCDLTGREILSMYSADKPYTIYDQDEWWSDKWNPLAYGRPFDFNRPFFEQFNELQKKVPRMSLNCIGNENSYYTNYALRNKSSYLVFTADYNEDSYYGRFGNTNVHCCDFDFTWDSTYCYETIDTHNCNACKFIQKCHNSSELYFCYDMRNCHNCIFCANLRNKNFHIFNKEVSKVDFAKFKANLNLSSCENLEQAKEKANEFFLNQPRKYLELLQCENVLGDYVKNSKNAYNCFDCKDLHDVKYSSQVWGAKDCYDWDYVAIGSELCYEMVSSAYNMFNCRFTMNSWDGNSDLTFCDLCLGNSNLFACVGLRKAHHCILNRQYAREEYDKLTKKIIEHMQKTGEWGEFLPAKYSPFCYNESVAQEYAPLTKEQAISKGLNWRDKDKKEYKKAAAKIPDNIKDTPDSIADELLACATCGKNYRLIKQELKFYKDSALPVPRKCYFCRHKDRMAKRNQRIFYDKTCSNCLKPIKTTYIPKEKPPVYCEKCYLENVD